MRKVKVDPSKLLGFQALQDTKRGNKVGAKVGGRVGAKVGAKPSTSIRME